MTKFIEWKGGMCPVHGGTLVTVKLRNGLVSGPARADSLVWTRDGWPGDIVEYAVVPDPLEHITAEYLLHVRCRRAGQSRSYWLMSEDVFRHLRKLQCDDGTYVYAPNPNGNGTVLGLPVQFDATGACGVLELLPLELLPDPVEHPDHYTSHPSGIECIQVTDYMSFNLGNAVKYICRADLKHDAIEDLREARRYIDRELKKRGENCE